MIPTSHYTALFITTKIIIPPKSDPRHSKEDKHDYRSHDLSLSPGTTKGLSRPATTLSQSGHPEAKRRSNSSLNFSAFSLILVGLILGPSTAPAPPHGFNPMFILRLREMFPVIALASDSGIIRSRRPAPAAANTLRPTTAGAATVRATIPFPKFADNKPRCWAAGAVGGFGG